MNRKIVVIGGSNIDIYAYSYHTLKLQDSNPGYIKRSYGGVGRNIAENLARLNQHPTFLTVLGQDEMGRAMLQDGQKCGIQFKVVYCEQTPTYLAVMDEIKEMAVAIVAMDEIKLLDIPFFESNKKVLEEADYIVLDTNIETNVMDYLFAHYRKPFFVDAISTKKAEKLRNHLSNIYALKVNLLEAMVLSQLPGASDEDIEAIGAFFLQQGVKEIFITLGSKGAYHKDSKGSKFKKAAKIIVKNATGAGDAFFAGVIYATMKSLDPLSMGMAASIITLMDDCAVSSAMGEKRIQEIQKEYQL
jgi:pseudouridine kinase